MGKKTEKRREQNTQRKNDTKKDARRRTEWSWMVPCGSLISFVTWLLLLLKHIVYEVSLSYFLMAAFSANSYGIFEKHF